MGLNTRHRRSLRLPRYDYSQANAYFLTICATNKEFLFGQIIDGNMNLSKAGQVVEEEWLKTANLRPYVKLDQFIIMPNHFHGILWIDPEPKGTARRAPTREEFGNPLAGSLPTIMRAFKAAVTNQINRLRGTPNIAVWQRNYYEHVIRNDKSLERIREYIINNPYSWELDRENPNRQGEHEFYRWLDSFKAPHGSYNKTKM